MQVTACDALGLVSYGPAQFAAVRLLAGDEASWVAGQLARKYPVKWRFLAWLTRQRQAYFLLLTP